MRSSFSSFFARYKWLLLALLVVGLIAVWLFMRESGGQARFSTATVTRGTIENLVTATGVLQPRDFVDVGAQVSGQLKVLHVDVGSKVNKGDLLAEIDATVYAARVEGTRAQLRNQQAQLKEREAQLKLARIKYQRQVNLLKEDATTAEELQSAEAQLQSAEAQLESLKAQLGQTQSNLQVEEANLEYARIYAPMTGTVVSLTSRQGQTLNANQVAPTVLRIADLSTMTVQAQVSEADISKLQVGMQVYFTTFGGGGKRWYSTLDRVEPTPTVLNNVVLYNALFDVPNPDGVLMTQMTTQVFFVVSQARNVLQVPVAALNFQKGGDAPAIKGEGPAPRADNTAPAGANPAAGPGPGPSGPRPEGAAERRPPNGGGERRRETLDPNTPRKATVRVLVGRDQIEEREVTVGVSNRVRAEVLSGLKEGEQVILGDASSAQAANANRPGFGGGMRMMR
ncbi:efflux RND transporter periplasmic adaptor subunit [Saccharophagus sp. K07]|jgi:macrolide-specific efflux system membrane fusion protein|uniref:efflux RND transporter periplasmic adaptor subunit n=1 Tax=Saccharophagus sp. K07 TaxID=2283636 RepID=UPI001652B35D|nr:efflux RND transporter periplasmic adaptor subunit [Saccharophagus sp. K07]MBC6905300.1 efflux RND transporter periplasmic adaptor subunit [Saccharophagus sp. K07]